MTKKPTYEELEQRVQDLAQAEFERKRVEEELRASVEKFRSIVESTSDWVWEVDQNGHYTYADPKIKDLLGYESEEVLGKPLYSLMPEEEAKRFASGFKHLTESPRPIKTVENIQIHKDGRHIVMETTAVPFIDKGGKLVGWRGASRDITERKQAEEVLRQREQKLRTIFESANDEILYLDQTGRIIDVNGRVRDIFGYEPAEVIGKNFAEFPFLDAEDMEKIIYMFNKLVSMGETRMASFEAKRKDGSKVFVEASPRLVELDDIAKGFLVIIRDITERKQAEEEKAELQAQLHHAQKIESLGTLAGGVAHEFNNILGIILGNTELAISGVPERNMAHGNLKEIRTACLRARDVVKQLLAFSRISKEELMPLRLSPVVKEALKLIRSSLPSTIEIRQDISDASDTVKANPTQINQIIINLCTNAAHAMQEEGGILTVKLEPVELGENDMVSYPDLTPGNYIRLAVSDTGCGMTSETAGRIFDPFFTTKEVGQGTGMGLSVVHGIIKDHGGSISVQSEPGKGTIFHVLFPAVEKMEETKHKLFESIPRGTERILFVDDEETLVSAAKANLEVLGYKVMGMTNPLEVLEIFKAQPEMFDLLISDVTMPGITGDRLAEEVMKIRPDIPVILCTGYSERISKEKAVEKGIKAFVMKPAQTREMANAIRQVLDQITEKTSFKSKLILVVDDENQIRSMLRMMLEGVGYEVMEAPDGKVALWCLKEKKADLIITDLIMPEKEGIETIIELKKDFPPVKIIAISWGGNVEAEQYLDMAKKVGADSILAKPFGKEELLKKVQELLA